MNPIRIQLSTTLAAALAALALSNPASAGVVFSESFEAPVVTGFVQNTVPSGGKWVGSTTGYGATNRGLYNETVAWPATPPFTTPYGAQAYCCSYTNSFLTTATGATGQTLTANVPYKVAFNTAVDTSITSANYKVELLASGTVLASTTGSVTTKDMSAARSLTFTPDGANAHLGKDVGIRLYFTNARVLYDNIRLITGHDMNPSPATGVVMPSGNTVLSWTNMPPNAPATNTYVDVFFGTNPAALTQVVDGVLTSTTSVNATVASTYYWRVDSYPDGDPNGTPVTGDLFSFIVIDTDGDGFPDSYELANTTPPSPTALDPSTDVDMDGLTAVQEYTYGTSPTNPDTDGDGLIDGPELTGVGLRPATIPVDFDSDDDGLSDGVETNTGTWVNASDTGTNPKDRDKDKDGLMDGAETNTGTVVDKNNTGTNPFVSDTDDDGVGDYYEVVACFTSPFDANDKPSVPYPLPDPDASTGVTNKPVKVYIMSGQSNMVGMGTVNGTDSKALTYMTRTQNLFPNLIDSTGNFIARQDVKYRGVISAIGNGPLAPGFGASSATFGPELGFGQIMGWLHDEPVLLIKSSIGNRALGWDILPRGTPSWVYGGQTFPGYGFPTPAAAGGWYAGFEFDRFFMADSEAAHPHTDAEFNVVDVLDNFATQYPSWAAQGFEIGGFVWWQGDRDRNTMGHATQYEANLVKLITELRSYYTNRYPGKVVPNAPFVLATLGQTAEGDTTPASDVAIFNGQRAVDGSTNKYPQFAGNVKTVYSHPLSEGGASNTHYDGRAGTYMLVGDALGRAMVDLLAASSGPDVNPPVATSFNPANGASGVSTGANLVATFHESIAIGTGSITIHPIDNSGDIVIAITDATQVTVSGTILTINPAANLSPSKQYAVQIDATAIDDLAGNSYPGITNNTTWSFTTATPDTTDPSLSTTDPANAASDVLVTANLVATFSEPVAIGTGNITLKNLTDGTQATIAVTDTTQVSISGSVLTVNPAANLLFGKTYAVQIANTAIDDLVGNSYAGITDDSTWSFTTAPPDLTPPSPDPMSFAVLPNALGETTVTMTATTATDPSGVEYLFECSAGGGPDSDWQIATVFTATGLAHSTTYTYTVKARDAALNETDPSAPASATTATPDTTAPTLSTSNPANGASGVLANANLVATFNEPIAIGTGNITLKNLTDGTQVVITLPNSQVTVAGSVLTINPTADLLKGKNYAVQIADTAIDDLAGNGYAGILNDSTWAFATEAPPPAGLVFADNFEAGANIHGGTTPDVTTYTVANTSQQANTTLWVRSTVAYKANVNGLVDETENGGANFTDPVGSQAYAFRYTNSGVTSAAGKIGVLTAGTTYTMSFDVVMDGWDNNSTAGVQAGFAYDARLIAFASGDDRATGGTMLKKVTGNATSDGLYKTVSFTYTTGDIADSAYLGYDLGIRFIGATSSANIDNVSISTAGPGGPGPVASFVISPIASPQTVGTPITGITLTAKDAANATATGFTGTVTFGGTGGFTGTSANFVAGVLTGVSATPTLAGSNLTLTVNDGASHTGSATIATIQTQYQFWAVGGVAFDADANNDGVDNGMAWVLGAANPSENALNKLPAATRNGTSLRLTFRCLKSTNRVGTVLKVQCCSDMGMTDPWVNHEAAVPDVDSTVNGVIFDTTDDGDYINVIADIPTAESKLFARLSAAATTQ